MKLGPQCNYHKGRAAIRHYANQPLCLNSVLNVKALVAAFNQEKALVGAFSVIVRTNCETDGSFYSTKNISCVSRALGICWLAATQSPGNTL